MATATGRQRHGRQRRMKRKAAAASAGCDRCGRRAPKVDGAQKNKIKEVLRMAASTRSSGGVEAVIVSMLRETEAGDEAVTAVCSRLEGPTAELLRKNVAARRHNLYCGNQTVLWNLNGGTLEQAREQKMKEVACSLRDQWFRVTEGGSLEAATSSPAAMKKVRPAAVGTLPSIQPNSMLPLTNASEGEAKIPEVDVRRVELRARASFIIPKRSVPHVPADWQQRQQLREVKSWKLQRLLLGRQEEDDLFFSIEAMRKKVKQWQGARGGRQHMVPPVAVIAAPTSSDTLPALTTQFSGHVWSVRGYSGTPAPFDARQCAAAQATPELGDHLQAMVDCGESTMSESIVRQLAGQATNGMATKFLLERWRLGLSVRGRRKLKSEAGMTVGLLGSGVGFSGYQTLSWMGGGRIAFAAEGCPIASAAGAAIDVAMGQSPIRFSRVEDPGLASAAMHVSVEWITLGCAQVSRRGTGEYLAAWLNEVAVTLAGTCARKPGGVFFETADGAWDCEDTKRRLESLFASCRQYRFVAYLISPDKHLGWGARRRRVYYVGTRKDAVWMGGIGEEVKKEERGGKEEVAVETRAGGEEGVGSSTMEGVGGGPRTHEGGAGARGGQREALWEKEALEEGREDAARAGRGGDPGGVLQMRDGLRLSLQKIDAVARTSALRRVLPDAPAVGMRVLLHAHAGELVVPARVTECTLSLEGWIVELLVSTARAEVDGVRVGGVAWQGRREGFAWVEGLPAGAQGVVAADGGRGSEESAAREEWRRAEVTAGERATREARAAAREWVGEWRTKGATAVACRASPRLVGAKEAVLPTADGREADEHGRRPWARSRQAWRLMPAPPQL